MPLRALAVLLLATPLAACTVGDITSGGGGGDDTGGGGDDTGGGGADAAVTPDYSLTMTPPTASTTLGTVSNYSLTLSSTNFEGPVTLTATGLPASWTAEFAPPTVTLGRDDTAIVALSITVPPNGDAAPAGMTIGVDAQAAPGLRQASTVLTVANEYVVAIPAGAGSGAHQFPGRIDLKLGASLRILNSDTTLHRIHSNGGAGFPHQETSMGQGESYPVTPEDVGGYLFYCHDHGEGTGVTNLVVQ
jgi:plastocyanin